MTVIRTIHGEFVEAAHTAERKLASIARTRRPTEAEAAEALAAYQAAARALDVALSVPDVRRLAAVAREVQS